MADENDGSYSHNVVHASDKFGYNPPLGSPLNPPGGGGTGGSMEARVAALEAHVEHIRGDISDIKGSVSSLQTGLTNLHVDVAVLKERVDHLPTKGFIIKVISTIVTLGTAVVGLIVTFQTAIQDLLGSAG